METLLLKYDKFNRNKFLMDSFSTGWNIDVGSCVYLKDSLTGQFVYKTLCRMA